ncbi:hypothetical protein [Stenotrophomonas maltophilia]|uniref:hypothetical protein n=1 Tax=Stenotrophomonas maltophilia TaxID=40324 RepID=UPI003B5FB8EF
MKRATAKPNLTQAQTNHLRRLLAWVRGEVGQTPQEMVETLRGLGPMPEPSAEAKARLVDSYKRAEAVPKYVRAAVKALEKLLLKQEGAIVDVEAGSGSDAGLEIVGTRHALLPALLAAQPAAAPPPVLSSPQLWTDQAPTEPGWYKFTCEETANEIERVLVVAERLTGQLLAVDTEMGMLALQHYHNGLTNPRWKKVGGSTDGMD